MGYGARMIIFIIVQLLTCLKELSLIDKKPHFPNLDALRTLAFLAVFFYHSFHTEYDYIKSDSLYQFVNSLFKSGDLGVNFFFVLSGFLITNLLMREEIVEGKIQLLSFYMRRVLRIWPLFFFTVFFGFVVFPFLKSLMGGSPEESANIWLFVSFLSNFNNIWNGLPDASMLGVLWSVSIEEQFYLFWPIVLILFKRMRPTIIIGLILLNIVFRYVNYDNYDIIYFHTLSVLSNLCVGGLLGYADVRRSSIKSFFSKVKRWQNVLVYLCLILLVIFRASIFQGGFMISLENVIWSLIFGWVILEQIYCEKSLIKFGRIRFLDFWGKYTYGLYCLHFIGILITTNSTKFLAINNSVYTVIFFETGVALSLSLLFSWISYQVLEKPFLKLKSLKYS